MVWLLEHEALQQIKAMENVTIDASLLDKMIQLEDVRSDDGDTAVISINGILSDTKNFGMLLFGGTLYSDIEAATQEAEADADISNIVYAVNSPGGSVSGLFQAMDTIRNTSKPTKAVVSKIATSAAFGLASSVDAIEATHESNMFGSVGVATELNVDSDKIALTSTQAQKKRPDITTEAGKAVVVEQLDAIHDLFVEGISKGRTAATNRTITKADVNKNYGEGAVVLAKDALSRGMIDLVHNAQIDNKTAPKQSAMVAEGKSNMDIAELKQKHPELYADCVAIGTVKERDRVTAHLTYGENCNAMTKAATAIKEGVDLTQTILAEYNTAGMNKQTIEDTQEEDVGASGVVDGDNQQDEEDVVADKVVNLMGLQEVV